MRPYPAGTDYYEAVKLLLPQLAEPERVTELVSQMSEVLADTADFGLRYADMQKAISKIFWIISMEDIVLLHQLQMKIQ